MTLLPIQYNTLLNLLWTGGMQPAKLAIKFQVTHGYISQLKKKLQLLINPPRFKEGILVCFNCGKSPAKKLVFHHDHRSGEVISLICISCNRKLGLSETNNKSFIYSQVGSHQYRIIIPKGDPSHPLKVIMRLFDKFSKDKWLEGLEDEELENLDKFMEEWEQMKGVWK
jgi:hypothetical protein